MLDLPIKIKGLILSGGQGSRLRPFTYTGAKQLVPIANKPILFYAIENLVECGVRDIGIVVGDTKDQVMAAVGDGSRFGVSVTYIEQEAPRGIAHAVKIAQPFLGDDPFVLFLGDNFLREGIVPFVDQFCRCDPQAREPDTALPRQEPAGLRRGGAARRPAGARRREAEGAAVEPGGHRHLPVRPHGLRGRERHQAFGARRAGDHRHHPVPGRPRPRRALRNRRRLLDRHRQDGRHPRGQPRDPGEPGAMPAPGRSTRRRAWRAASSCRRAARS